MSVEFIKEAIQEVQVKNTEYAAKKVTEISNAIQKFKTELSENPQQDESMYVYIFYRKWSNMESHGVSYQLDYVCNHVDHAMAEKIYRDVLSGKVGTPVEDDE